MLTNLSMFLHVPFHRIVYFLKPALIYYCLEPALSYVTFKIRNCILTVLKQFRLSTNHANESTQQASVNDGNVTATVSLPSSDAGPNAEYGKFTILFLIICLLVDHIYKDEKIFLCALFT